MTPSLIRDSAGGTPGYTTGEAKIPFSRSWLLKIMVFSGSRIIRGITGVARIHLGNDPAFIVPDYSFVDARELVFYLGLALLAGIVGAITIRVLHGIEDMFEGLKFPFWGKAVAGGLIMGTTGYFYPELFGNGYETVSAVLLQETTFSLMVVLLGLKILMMSVTLASGGVGGVFAPSLYIGAMLGGSYGFAVHHFFPNMTASFGAYALVGMAAMFAATSGAIFTSIVIIFEMTRSYSIILPLMLACVVAEQVSAILMKNHTIFSIKLARKGVSVIKSASYGALTMTPVKSIMTKDLITLRDDMTLGEAEKVIARYSVHMVYPVVDKKGTFLGLVRGSNISYQYLIKGPSSRLLDHAVKEPRVVGPDDSVLDALKNLDDYRDPRVVVVDKQTRELLGIVSPTDFVRFISKEVQE